MIRGMGRASLWVLTFATALSSAHSGHAQTARIVIVPDTQNEVTVNDQEGTDGDTKRAAILALQAQDIIEWRPDFVIQVGDLTDSTGGSDQQGAARLADDPNSAHCTTHPYVPYCPSDPAACNCTNQAQDSEWQRIRQGLFDKLDAAGIPHIETLGNH